MKQQSRWRCLRGLQARSLHPPIGLLALWGDGKAGADDCAAGVLPRVSGADRGDDAVYAELREQLVPVAIGKREDYAALRVGH